MVLVQKVVVEIMKPQRIYLKQDYLLKEWLKMWLTGILMELTFLQQENIKLSHGLAKVLDFTIKFSRT